MNIQFTWSDEYSVGNEVLDSQHKHLFDLGNRIQQAKPSEAKAYVMSLYKYIRLHFTEEEHHMEKIGFPGVDGHRMMHEQLITRLNDLSDGFTPDMIDELARFLHDWILNHLLKEDHQYFVYVRSL